MRSTSQCFSLIGIVGLLGCGGLPVEATAIGHRSDALTVENGRELNGRELNGRELNGRELNGRELNGVSLGAAALGGVELSGLRLEGTLLIGTRPDGSEVTGQALVGATLAPAEGSGSLVLRIDGYAQAADPDINLYEVSYSTGHAFKELCGREMGAPIAATALAGRWNYQQGVPGGGSFIDDPSAFTFACEDGALFKCTEIGYKPWQSVDGQSLAPVHQACTRAVRADYCGDGTSHTRDGTLIDIYDGLSVQVDTESWDFEAEWTTDGARCVNHRRIQSRRPPPACVRALETADCGDVSGFQTGTLVMTEAQ